MLSTNPVARYYEAQTAATAEIVQAALSGMHRLQQITLQAMRNDTTTPASEQTANFQRELMQAITDMNQDIVRASYSLMERMREAMGSAMPGVVAMPTGFPLGNEAMANPMALYDTAMRQWQTTVQQMMEAPSVAMAVAGAVDEDEVGSAPKSAARQSTRKQSKKRKSTRKK